MSMHPCLDVVPVCSFVLHEMHGRWKGRSLEMFSLQDCQVDLYVLPSATGTALRSPHIIHQRNINYHYRTPYSVLYALSPVSK